MSKKKPPEPKKRPPDSPGEAAVLAGQGDPKLDLGTQVRGQVNWFTIDSLANAVEDAQEEEARRKNGKKK